MHRQTIGNQSAESDKCTQYLHDRVICCRLSFLMLCIIAAKSLTALRLRPPRPPLVSPLGNAVTFAPCFFVSTDPPGSRRPCALTSTSPTSILSVGEPLRINL